MIYNEKYRVRFYQDSRTAKSDVYRYITSLNIKVRSKIIKYIEYLRDNNGYLGEPYSRHIDSSLRELRVDFSNNRYRVFYYLLTKKRIVILHAFLKKTQKTPRREIVKAKKNLIDCINNIYLYE